MDQNRLKLHEKLCEILGSRNVYFQPPASVKMQYPAIVYNLKDIDPKHANNLVDTRFFCYAITVIDRNPDSEIVDEISQLPMCSMDRPSYASDGLNHFVFTLYY